MWSKILVCGGVRGAALVAVTAACGPAPAPASVGPAPTAAPAVDPVPEARSVVEGQVRAHDGSPLKQARLTIQRNEFREAVHDAPLPADGSFRVELPGPGFYHVSVAAVDHGVLWLRLLVEGPVRFEGELGTYARPDPGPHLPIRIEAVNGSGEVLARESGQARRDNRSRTYRLRLPGLPDGTEEIRYQIVSGDPGGRTYNAPGAARYVYDGGGDYWSVVDAAGTKELTIDLSALPPPGLEATIVVEGDDPLRMKLLQAMDGWNREHHRLSLELASAETPEPERARAMVALARESESIWRDEPDPRARGLLRVAWLANVGGELPEAERREHWRWVLAHLPPDEPYLGMVLNLFNQLFMFQASSDVKDREAVFRYLDRVRRHPDPGTASRAYGELLWSAQALGDAARVRELYELMRADERLAGTYGWELARYEFDPDRILQPGREFPAYAFQSLTPGADPIRGTDFRGKIYLLEFWATWCGPCVADMPALHRAYAEINGARPGGKGEAGLRKLRPVSDPQVEFVFVSVDGSPGDVEKFRGEEWSMPWVHAWHPDWGALGEQYGFGAVPAAILVGADGQILATGDPVRGEHLLGALETILAPGQ